MKTRSEIVAETEQFEEYSLLTLLKPPVSNRPDFYKEKFYEPSDVAEIKRKLLEEVFERLKLDLDNHGYRILSVPLKEWDKLKQSLIENKTEVEEWKK